MRVFKYVIFSAIALVAMVFSLNAALAQPQATPVTEPESTNVQSRSTLNQPLMTGEPIYSYDYPESIGVLPDADYHFTLDFDLSGVEFEIPDNHISLRYSFERTNTEGASSTATRLVDVGRVSTLTFQSWNFLDASLNRDCIANEGWIKGTLNFSISNNQTSEILYTADQHSVNIPCSATVTPEAPAEPVPQCGPGNDEIAIPAQSGVIVQDTG